MSSASHDHLPRLSAEAYRGRRIVHWTMTIAGRKLGWLSADFHLSFRAILTDHFEKYRVAVPAYCLMPDHLHIVAAGLSAAADQHLWVRAVRRATNHLLTSVQLQKQAHDHVLRPAESGRDSFAALVRYICENPLRAGLVTRAQDWPFVGSSLPALPALDPRDSEFLDMWWAHWNVLRD